MAEPNSIEATGHGSGAEAQPVQTVRGEALLSFVSLGLPLPVRYPNKTIRRSSRQSKAKALS